MPRQVFDAMPNSVNSKKDGADQEADCRELFVQAWCVRTNAAALEFHKMEKSQTTRPLAHTIPNSLAVATIYSRLQPSTLAKEGQTASGDSAHGQVGSVCARVPERVLNLEVRPTRFEIIKCFALIEVTSQHTTTRTYHGHSSVTSLSIGVVTTSGGVIFIWF